MSATRQLVAESHEDGTARVLSLPLVRWQKSHQPPPGPAPEELADEIRLLLADAQIEPQPLITHASDGQIRLIWPRDLERLAEGVVLALAPEIRRSRRARRSAQARAPKPQKP